MEPSEADKIIAEFMGFEFRYGEQGFYPVYMDGNIVPTISRAGPEYTSSLDALVPVWEELDICMKIEWLRYNGVIFYLEKPKEIEVHHTCSVTSEITEAAAIATAKAIKEMGDKIKGEQK